MEFSELRGLYDRCHPDEPLQSGDARYVDLDEARGIRWVDVLERRLGLTERPVQLLVSGGRGAGKTTEFRRLAERIPGSLGLLPLRVDIESFVDDPRGLDAIDLGLAILTVVRQALRFEEQPDPALALTLWERFEWLVHRRTNNAPTTHEAGWTAQEVKQELRELYRRDPGEFVRLVDATLARAYRLANQQGRSTSRPVLIVDSLDRVPLAETVGPMLSWFERLSVSTIFTVPIGASLHADPIVLPMVRLVDRDGAPVAAGAEAMRRAIDVRIDGPSLTYVFGQEHLTERVDALVRTSGGCIRELLHLIRAHLEVGDLPLRESDLQHVYARRAEALSIWKQGATGASLDRVAREKPSASDLHDEPIEAVAFVNGLLYPYRERGELWFDVHPTLRNDYLDPSPPLRKKTPPATTIASEKHTLYALRLTNIGPFHELSLDLRPGWNVLLGDNGCGKTSVIRAIALALAGTDPHAAIASQRQLRAQQSAGSVALTTDHGEHSTSLNRLPTEVRASTAADTLTQRGRWLTLGFPAVRGLSTRAISGPTAVAPAVPGAHDLLPLLEGAADARLDDTRQWIVNTALRADGNESEEIRDRHRRLLDRWFEILRKLMPGLPFEYDRVDRESWQVFVKTADGTIPIEQLSQGMVSTIGWIGTLLRRLYEAFPHSAEPEHEPALVLVDEIDAHLHPTWQQRIVPLVRSHFPNVQVIATSHSPLIVSNLEPDEIVVFSRDATGRIEWSRVGEPVRGYRVDQVLTSPAFGLVTTRGEYARKLLDEYTEALSQGTDTPEARARLADLTARVRREIPSPPETIAERIALDGAVRETDEAVRAELASATPEKIEELEAMLSARRSRGGTS